MATTVGLAQGIRVGVAQLETVVLVQSQLGAVGGEALGGGNALTFLGGAGGGGGGDKGEGKEGAEGHLRGGVGPGLMLGLRHVILRGEGHRNEALGPGPHGDFGIEQLILKSKGWKPSTPFEEE